MKIKQLQLLTSIGLQEKPNAMNTSSQLLQLRFALTLFTFIYCFTSFSKPAFKMDSPNKLATTEQEIGVIELRNYIIKPLQRDRFADYFKANFVDSQNEMGASILGYYKVKESDNNFFWMRGFSDMTSRGKFLPAFYTGPVWKKAGPEANQMLVNNDNVYLLKPLTWKNNSLETGKSISTKLLRNEKGITVVDFYIANNKLDKLISFFSKNYLPALKNNGIENYSLWISELSENDFPRLPVFQDKNLLVAITFYKDEVEYRESIEKINASINPELKTELMDIITTKNSVVLYPFDEKIPQKKILEVRTYNLKENSRDNFNKLVNDLCAPMLKRWKIDVVAYGPSLHDKNTYTLVRSYNSIEEMNKSEDAFYGSDEWKKGPREPVLALIENYTTLVIDADEKTIRLLGESIKH